MRPLLLPRSIVLAAAALLTCAATAAQPARESVPVYDSTQIAFDRYTVISRVGVEGWESAFRIRGHRDLESAKQAVVDAAGRAGADGVVNLTCFDRTDGFFERAGYYCYGNAIKAKQ